MSDDLQSLILALAFETLDARAPTDDELAEAPVLEDWRIAVTDHGLALVGRVIGHPILGDRPSVVTSLLIAFKPQHGWCRTRSRVYRLGKRHGGKDGD
jgi:hypothetical protein